MIDLSVRSKARVWAGTVVGTLFCVLAATLVDSPNFAGFTQAELAKALTKVRVIATASRERSRTWVRAMGADTVVDHHDLEAQAVAVAPAGVDYLFSPHSRGNVGTYAEIVRPFGHITAIDEPEGLDLVVLKPKSIAWHWDSCSRVRCSATT